jgi:hypothetical protein
MTARLPIQRKGVCIECERGGETSVAVDEIFVVVAAGSERADMVQPRGSSALDWKEISLRAAELLIVLGAHAEVDFELGSEGSSQLSPAKATSLGWSATTSNQTPTTPRDESWKKPS